MENLKALIKSADDQLQLIGRKKDLQARFDTRNEPLQISSDGYCSINLNGDRKAKIVKLFESFIKEDEAKLAPLTDKLNTISILLGSD